MGKKNPLGFTENQLRIILDFCNKVRKVPRISYNEFHRRYSSYSRKQSTIDLLNKAYSKIVISGPFLFSNTGIIVRLESDCSNPKELLNNAIRSGTITWGIALQGDWSFISFSYGASTLECANTITPTHLSKFRLEDIEINEKGESRRDPYPHGWDDIDWEVFTEMRVIRKKSYIEIARKIGVGWETVRNRFEKILGQCKVMSCFFPLGYEGYQYVLLTFKTEIEIGLVNSLKKLDRTSYLYKHDGMIILILFLPPEPLSVNKAIDKFKELEEMGIIHDLRVSIPREWHNTFV